MADKKTPLFIAEDEARMALETQMMVDKLQRVAETEGLTTAIAVMIGMSWGLAHVFKTLGLIEIHRDLRKKLAAFMGSK